MNLIKLRFFSKLSNTNKKVFDQLTTGNDPKVVLFCDKMPLVENFIYKDYHSYKIRLLTGEQCRDLICEDDIKIYMNSNPIQFACSLKEDRSANVISHLKDKFSLDCLWVKNPLDFIKLYGPDRENIMIYNKVKGLFEWHYSNLFCGYCGSKTEAIKLGHARKCTNSNCSASKSVHLWISHPRIDPTVMFLPYTNEDPLNKLPACLLGRKENYPPGFMSCLSGFIEPGETVEKSVIRELKEETQLEAINKPIYYGSEYFPFPSTLLLGYHIQVPNATNFNIDSEELSLAGWFNIDEVEQMIKRKHVAYFIPPTFSISFKLIKLWYDNYKLK